MRIPSGIFWRCKIDEILTMSFYTWFSVWFCLFGFLQKFATFCASVCEARLRLWVKMWFLYYWVLWESLKGFTYLVIEYATRTFYSRGPQWSKFLKLFIETCFWRFVTGFNDSSSAIVKVVQNNIIVLMVHLVLVSTRGVLSTDHRGKITLMERTTHKNGQESRMAKIILPKICRMLLTGKLELGTRCCETSRERPKSALYLRLKKRNVLKIVKGVILWAFWNSSLFVAKYGKIKGRQ